MNSTHYRLSNENKKRRGFTFVELLVILVVLALIALTLLPALAGARGDSRSFRCLNNQRQLAVAWRMYAEDNNDYLPGNDFPWTTSVAAIVPHFNATCWAPGSVLVTQDSTNVNILQDRQISQLYSYVASVAVYKCPADPAKWFRSMSMNSAIGTLWYSAPAGQKGVLSVSGGWLPGSAYNASQTTWRTYGKCSAMIAPTPANLWLLMDEHPDSINDATLEVPAVPNYLVDYPASYHDGGAGLVYADGHTELHKWQDPQTKVPFTGIPNSVIYLNDPGNVDTAWLAQRTSARR